MTEKDYCSNVCGGKCCKVYHPSNGKEFGQCPQLTEDNLCNIYEKRYREKMPYYFTVIDNNFAVHSYRCGYIKQIIAENKLPKWIEDQCCHAHPELLEVDHVKKLDEEIS